MGKIGLGFAAVASSAHTIWILANFRCWSGGGSLVVDDGAGGFMPGIEPEQVAAVIDCFGTCREEDLTAPGSLGLDNWADPAVLEPMIRGEQLAIIVQVFTADQMFRDRCERNSGAELLLTTAMTPHGSSEPTTHLGGQSLCINSNAATPRRATSSCSGSTRASSSRAPTPNTYPAQGAPLADKPFPAEMQGLQDQYTKGARRGGPYAQRPAAIAVMWNQTSRSFGASYIGEKTSLEAAEELLAFVQSRL